MFNTHGVIHLLCFFLIVGNLNHVVRAKAIESNAELFSTKYEKKRSAASPKANKNQSLDPESLINMMGQSPGSWTGIIDGNDVGTILNAGNNSPVNQAATLGMINNSPVSSITGILDGSNPLDKMNLGEILPSMNGSDPMDQLGSLGWIEGNNVGTILNTGDNSPVNQVANLGMANGSPLSSISGTLNGNNPLDQIGNIGEKLNDRTKSLDLKDDQSLSENSDKDENEDKDPDLLGSMGTVTQLLSVDQLSAAFGGNNPGQIINVGDNTPINQVTNFLQQILVQRSITDNLSG